MFLHVESIIFLYVSLLYCTFTSFRKEIFSKWSKSSDFFFLVYHFQSFIVLLLKHFYYILKTLKNVTVNTGVLNIKYVFFTSKIQSFLKHTRYFKKFKKIKKKKIPFDSYVGPTKTHFSNLWSMDQKKNYFSRPN